MASYKGIKSKNGIVCAPVRASAAVQRKYQKKIDELIKEMTNSVYYWVQAEYRKRESEITQDSFRNTPSGGLRVRRATGAPSCGAQGSRSVGAYRRLASPVEDKASQSISLDASPTAALQKALKELAKRWGLKFTEGSSMAKWFVNAVHGNVNKQLAHSIKTAADVTVKFKMTRPLQNVLKASIAQNVTLIKSIPAKYFTEIEGLVMGSVTRGGDLKYLTDAIKDKYGSTRRYAANLARDQVNKVTSVISVQQQKELGVTKNKWVHSGTGKHPRPSHEAADGEEYDLDKGCYIDGKYIHPGQAINCRCTSSAIVPLFNKK